MSNTQPLAERLQDDQSLRWRAGERPLVESYLAAHPELGDDGAGLLDLLNHEVLLREERGEAPRLTEYLGRFPHLAAPLRDLFEVHALLEAEAGVGGPTTLGGATLAAAPAAPPNVPGYEVLQELGRGGMGIVYLAWQAGPNRQVALKMIRAGGGAGPDELTRFRTEAEAAARLEHPNIVRLYEVGAHDGRPYFSLEYVAGGSLSAALSGTPQPPRLAAELLEPLARAIHYAHERGVVHRDLTPNNVLLQKPEARRQKTEDQPGASASVFCLLASGFSPKITDFGLAKLLGSGGGTQTGDILGTPSYMAPEQAAGRSKDAGPATDIYALGAILYEVLTGRPPFRGATAMDTLVQVAAGEPVPPRSLQPGVPRDLETVCLRCLEKEPSRRYASAADLADDLHRFREGLPVRARPLSPAGRLLRWCRRRPAVAGLLAVLAAVVLAALALAVGGGLYWQGQRAQRHHEVSRAQEAAAGQLRAGEFAAAQESLTRAKDRLGEDRPAEIVGRQERLQAAWQLVQDLEQIQLRRMTPTDEGRFDNETAQKSYEETFAAAGYDLTGGDPQEVAERIRASPVVEPILEAIDNWALVCAYGMRYGSRPKKEYQQRRDRLLEVARAVDPHPEVRDKVRNPQTWDDRRQLEALAELAPRTDLSPRLAALLAEVLDWAGGDPERLLRTFQTRHPGDFWLNYGLGYLLVKTKPTEALRFYQAALAVRPHHTLVLSEMGVTLYLRRDWDEAISLYERALADEPGSIGLRNNLAAVLLDKGDIEGAVALFRENVRLRPALARSHFSLGRGLNRLGRFADALESLRRAHQLATETGAWLPSAAEKAVRDTERLVELDRRLSAGKPEPSDAAESLQFAEVCFLKTRYVDSAGFYRRAFEQEPKLAADLDAEYRHDGACAAALAAAGRGEGAESLDAPRRAELRKQALTWLREDLEAWGRRAPDPKNRPTVNRTLRLWQRHPNLASLRDPAAVAQLPADEQPACKQLWADVEELLGRVQEGN